MMKRILSLALVVVLIIVVVVPVLAVPVKAESNGSDWIELLETATVDDSGSNLYTLNGQSGFFRIKTPQYMRCTKVDMLISHATGYTPKAVKVYYNGGYYTLTMAKIDGNTTRVYGDNIPDTLYADLVFEIIQNGTGTAYYQILSCRVTPLNNSTYAASAYADISGTKHNAPFFLEVQDDTVGDFYDHYEFPIVVTDWQKFDKLIISGSVGSMALNSIRCTIAGIGLPYEMTYAVSNSSSSDVLSYTWNEYKYYSYDESYKGTSETESFIYHEYDGKVLYTITVDLTGVDRSVKDPLYCWFVGLANPVQGFTIQVTGVTGQVNIADTSEMSLWQRFTNFMSDLFGEGEGQESVDNLDEGSESISQGAADIGSFEQSQQDTLNTGFATITAGISFTSFSAALLFVQKYINMTFNGISQYAIVFTLPLFLGLFFYLCSRIPGVTRWKSKPPQSKGGESP